MIVFLLGIMDLIAAFSFVSIHFGWFSTTFYIIVISFLGIKAIAFKGDVASILDGICAAFLLLMLLGMSSKLFWLPFLYLLQKSVFSLKSMF